MFQKCLSYFYHSNDQVLPDLSFSFVKCIKYSPFVREIVFYENKIFRLLNNNTICISGLNGDEKDDALLIENDIGMIKNFVVGKRFLLCWSNRTICIWDLLSLSIRHSIQTKSIESVTLSTDGKKGYFLSTVGVFFSISLDTGAFESVITILPKQYRKEKFHICIVSPSIFVFYSSSSFLVWHQIRQKFIYNHNLRFHKINFVKPAETDDSFYIGGNCLYRVVVGWFHLFTTLLPTSEYVITDCLLVEPYKIVYVSSGHTLELMYVKERQVISQKKNHDFVDDIITLALFKNYIVSYTPSNKIYIFRNPFTLYYKEIWETLCSRTSLPFFEKNDDVCKEIERYLYYVS